MSLTTIDLTAIGNIVEKVVDRSIDTKVVPMFIELKEEIDKLSTSTATGFNEMTERFNGVDEQFAQVEQKLTSLEGETSRLSGNISGLRQRVDKHERQLTRIETKSA